MSKRLLSALLGKVSMDHALFRTVGAFHEITRILANFLGDHYTAVKFEQPRQNCKLSLFRLVRCLADDSELLSVFYEKAAPIIRENWYSFSPEDHLELLELAAQIEDHIANYREQEKGFLLRAYILYFSIVKGHNIEELFLQTLLRVRELIVVTSSAWEELNSDLLETSSQPISGNIFGEEQDDDYLKLLLSQRS